MTVRAEGPPIICPDCQPFTCLVEVDTGDPLRALRFTFAGLAPYFAIDVTGAEVLLRQGGDSAVVTFHANQLLDPPPQSAPAAIELSSPFAAEAILFDAEGGQTMPVTCTVLD